MTNNLEFWLIGQSIADFSQNNLPTKVQVLQRFLHLHIINKNIIQASARIASKEIITIWNKCKLYCIEEQNIVIKIKQLHNLWLNLKKNKFSNLESQRQKRNDFINSISLIFDVGYADTFQRIHDVETLKMYRSAKLGKRQSQVNVTDTQRKFHFQLKNESVCEKNQIQK